MMVSVFTMYLSSSFRVFVCVWENVASSLRVCMCVNVEEIRLDFVLNTGMWTATSLCHLASSSSSSFVVLPFFNSSSLPSPPILPTIFSSYLCVFVFCSCISFLRNLPPSPFLSLCPLSSFRFFLSFPYFSPLHFHIPFPCIPRFTLLHIPFLFFHHLIGFSPVPSLPFLAPLFSLFNPSRLACSSVTRPWYKSPSLATVTQHCKHETTYIHTYTHSYTHTPGLPTPFPSHLPTSLPSSFPFPLFPFFVSPSVL